MLLGLILAATVAMTPDGARWHPDEACYAIYGPAAGGEKVLGATYQSLRRETYRGAPVWRVIVHQRLSRNGFDLRDDLILDARTLRPIRLDTTRSGAPYAALEFTESRVTGFKLDKQGAKQIVDQPLPGPVWEGDLYGPTFAALPLKEGAHFTLPFYQYDRGFGAFTISVQGQRTVETPSGAVEAWVVDAGPSASERLTYLIGKIDGRELGFFAPQGGQRLGGDCTGVS